MSSKRFISFLIAVASPLLMRAEPPVPVRTAAPEYPAELRQAGVSGLVFIKCLVDPQGNVAEAVVEKSSDEKFNAAALDAVKKWKFKPGQKDGAPVAMKVTIPIRFAVEGA